MNTFWQWGQVRWACGCTVSPGSTGATGRPLTLLYSGTAKIAGFVSCAGNFSRSCEQQGGLGQAKFKKPARRNFFPDKPILYSDHERRPFQFDPAR